jgi:hypothetical protein
VIRPVTEIGVSSFRRLVAKMPRLLRYFVAGVNLGMLIALSGNCASSTTPRLVPKQAWQFWPSLLIVKEPGRNLSAFNR